MAIQMRRGAYAEFDPLKMKAGEWAVSTDSDTKKQQIWMCFAPGIVKRMGTVEDFDTEIQRLIQSYLGGMAQSVSQAQNQQNLPQAKLKNHPPLQVMLKLARPTQRQVKPTRQTQPQKQGIVKPMLKRVKQKLKQVRPVRLPLQVMLKRVKQILRPVKLMLRNQRLMHLQAQLTQKQ